MSKRLQVFKDGKWQYVFCYNAQTNEIITTNDYKKALKPRDLEFFKNKYGNDKFRIKNRRSF